MARQSNSDAVYAVADLFRQRCLVGDASLLWPDRTAWTLANIDALWDTSIGRPDEGKRSFMEKWHDQLAGQSPDVHRVAADVMAFYYLFPSNIGLVAKLAGVREVISWKLAEDPPAAMLTELTEAFGQQIGHAGIYYLTGRVSQIAYYLEFARRLKRDGVDPFDPEACQRLADSIRGEIGGSAGARNILLHLLFPDRYEDTASDDYKHRIVAGFHEYAGAADDLDQALLAIRTALAGRMGGFDFDFYRPDIRLLWDTAGAVTPPAPPPAPPTPHAATFDELVAATFLRPHELREIEALLVERRQLVFEGPPGSGKTYVAELVARWFAGLPLGGPATDQVELVQFHQSYGYEDFVQGIRPETDPNGHLRYRVRDGIFKRLCEIAASSPDRRYVLVIDEINRGNTARVFGELLLLLEYRAKRARLPYASADAGDEAYLSIPDNLYLIGTMNSTDRSLAQVDYALRRRFYFRRFLPVEDDQAPVLEGWLRAHDISAPDRERLVRIFVALNRKIQEHLSDDFQLGHSYFMVPDIATPAVLERVWRRAVRPLLEEYFHHHRDRDTILALMAQTMEQAGPSDNAVVTEAAE